MKPSERETKAFVVLISVNGHEYVMGFSSFERSVMVATNIQTIMRTKADDYVMSFSTKHDLMSEDGVGQGDVPGLSIRAGQVGMCLHFTAEEFQRRQGDEDESEAWKR